MAALVNPVGICAKLDKGSVIKTNADKFHQMCGQTCDEDVKRTAKSSGHEIIGKFSKCAHCARAKAKRKKISKMAEDMTQDVGERIAMDSTGCRKTSIGGNKCVNLKIDYESEQVFSNIHEKEE